VKEVRARIRFVFVRTVGEVLDAALGPGLLPWRAPDAHHPLVESTLRKIGRVVKERETDDIIVCI
jgi:hypothetical protein